MFAGRGPKLSISAHVTTSMALLKLTRFCGCQPPSSVYRRTQEFRANATDFGFSSCGKLVPDSWMGPTPACQKPHIYIIFLSQLHDLEPFRTPFLIQLYTKFTIDLYLLDHPLPECSRTLSL